MDNLVVLCRHHHHLVHEGGFVCEKLSNGEIKFKDQREQALDSSPTMPGVCPEGTWHPEGTWAAHDDVQQWMDREFFDANIDSETCQAQWQAGNRMDWQMAVSALF